jgi:TorA maturation chaperone TorD
MTATATVEACESALLRSGLYGMTARLLAEPALLLDPEPYEQLRKASEGHAAFRDLLPAIEDTARAAKGEGLNARTLEQEYTFLFRKAQAAPYEGSYLPATRASLEMADVAGFLRAFGMVVRSERPDHVVSELEFMALLCLKESLAQGNGKESEAAICRDAQGKFLRDHLGRWPEAFHRSVVKAAHFPVFTALAFLARRLVEIDAGVLGVSPEPIVEGSKDEPEAIPQCGVGG